MVNSIKHMYYLITKPEYRRIVIKYEFNERYKQKKFNISECLEDFSKVLDILDDVAETVQNMNNFEEYVILYKEKKGLLTTRRITIQYKPKPYSLTLNSYCHLRMANRDFRIDRILEIVKLDTQK